jgi:hypothetical protein
MKKLIGFLNKLEENKIYYKLNKVRDAVMVEVAVPGQRWEIEFFGDEHIEIEKFISDGTIYSKSEIESLFSEFGEA